jgi:hypothetical protein
MLVAAGTIFGHRFLLRPPLRWAVPWILKNKTAQCPTHGAVSDRQRDWSTFMADEYLLPLADDEKPALVALLKHAIDGLRQIKKFFTLMFNDSSVKVSTIANCPSSL